jgi:sulfate adenylyltransferase subunit 1
MVASIAGEADQNAREYSAAEKELNAYVRKHFPEWGCTEV